MPTNTNKRTSRNLPNTTVPPTPPVVVPEGNTQIDAIVVEVTGAFDALTQPQAQVDLAKADLKSAEDNAFSVKETLVVRLAGISLSLGWTADHITDAVGKAVEAWNGTNTTRSMSQFGTELRRAMHPDAREHVEQAITDAKAAFAEEAAAVKAARDADQPKPATPITSKYARAWQLVMRKDGLLQAHIDGKPEAASPEMLADAVIAADKADSGKAARWFGKIVKQLDELYGEFPAKEVKVILDYAKRIKRDTLDAAKATQERQQKRQPAAPQPAKATQPTSDDVDVGAAVDAIVPSE